MPTDQFVPEREHEPDRERALRAPARYEGEHGFPQAVEVEDAEEPYASMRPHVYASYKSSEVLSSLVREIISRAATPLRDHTLRAALGEASTASGWALSVHDRVRRALEGSVERPELEAFLGLGVARSQEDQVDVGEPERLRAADRQVIERFTRRPIQELEDIPDLED